MKIKSRLGKEKYLSETKLKGLQESQKYLDNYKHLDSNEFHFVTERDTKNRVHIGKTQALAMLASCNIQREHLIQILLED